MGNVVRSIGIVQKLDMNLQRENFICWLPFETAKILNFWEIWLPTSLGQCFMFGLQSSILIPFNQRWFWPSFYTFFQKIHRILKLEWNVMSFYAKSIYYTPTQERNSLPVCPGVGGAWPDVSGTSHHHLIPLASPFSPSTSCNRN